MSRSLSALKERDRHHSWREVYAEMGVDPDGHDDDRGRSA